MKPARRRATLRSLTTTLFLLSVWMAVPTLALAQDATGTTTAAAFSLPTILTMVTGHAWLPLAVLVTVYVRHLLSDQSKLPVTIPARWLPSVTAFAGLLFTVLVARQAGAAWGVSLLAGFTAAAATGFFDGLVVGMFGSDPTKVPGWAKALLLLVDDLGGSGAAGAGAGEGETKTPPPAAAGGGASNAAPKASLFGAYRPRPIVAAFARRMWPWSFARIAARARALPEGAASSAVMVGALVLASAGCFCAGAELMGCGGAPVIPANTQADIQSTVALVYCVESTYQADAAKVPQPSPITFATDIAAACGPEAVNVFDTWTSSPQISASRKAVAQAAHDNPAPVKAAAASFHPHAVTP